MLHECYCCCCIKLKNYISIHSLIVGLQIGKLGALSWGLPDHSYYYKHGENVSKIVAYKTYMSTVASLFNMTENKTKEFVNNTFNLEKRLAQVGIYI